MLYKVWFMSQHLDIFGHTCRNCSHAKRIHCVLGRKLCSYDKDYYDCSQENTHGYIVINWTLITIFFIIQYDISQCKQDTKLCTIHVLWTIIRFNVKTIEVYVIIVDLSLGIHRTEVFWYLKIVSSLLSFFFIDRDISLFFHGISTHLCYSYWYQITMILYGT